MTQDNISFYTLNHTFTSIPFKQKKNLFSSPSDMYKTIRNPEDLKSASQIEIKTEDLVTRNWQPRLASKKLLEEPKFLLSLQRKKYRVISAIKDMSQFKSEYHTTNMLQGKKIKAKSKSFRNTIKNEETLPKLIHQHTSLQKYASQERVGWQSHTRTPFLNFNMQYLIKKRKKMPSPQKEQHKIGVLRFNQLLNNK